MQIHEITTKQQLDEGLLDLAKKAAGGVAKGISAVQNVGQKISQPFKAVKGAYKDVAQQSKIANIANSALQTWSTYAVNLAKSTPDPARYEQLYKQNLTAFVQKNLLANQSLGNAINAQEITKLINDITANRNDAQKLPGLFSELVKQSALSKQDPSRGAGMLSKVVSVNPAVIQFRNKTYVIGNQGEWIDQGTGTPADQSFQAFLDQELAKATP